MARFTVSISLCLAFCTLAACSGNLYIELRDWIIDNGGEVGDSCLTSCQCCRTSMQPMECLHVQSRLLQTCFAWLAEWFECNLHAAESRYCGKISGEQVWLHGMNTLHAAACKVASLLKSLVMNMHAPHKV